MAQAKREKRQKTLSKVRQVAGKKHKGEYLAISNEGKIILGKNDVNVLKQAIEKFGIGNFAFKRVSRQALGQWLKVKK